mgnify:FL=1
MGLLSYAQGYLYFICNDHDYFQDVEKLNRRIDKHNKNIGELELRKADIQAKIASGELLLPPPPPPAPAPVPAPIPAPAGNDEAA